MDENIMEDMADKISEQTESNIDNDDSTSRNFPDFKCKLDKTNQDWGSKEASYITGFIGTINQLGLSEKTLGNIIIYKISMEYQKEMLRMKLESEERIASIYSQSPLGIMLRKEKGDD